MSRFQCFMFHDLVGNHCQRFIQKKKVDTDGENVLKYNVAYLRKFSNVMWRTGGRSYFLSRGKNCNSLQPKNNAISLWTLNFSLAFKDLYQQFWKKTEFSNAAFWLKQSQSYMKMQVGVWRWYRLGSASMVES